MPLIKVAGLDPALRNFGISLANLDLDSLKIDVTDLILIQTDRRVNKVVRQNSDDLRRAAEIVDQYHKAIANCTVVFSEIPSGGQSADAVKSFGISIGMLASCPVPLIQVQPHETKLAATGSKFASKDEIIEWAADKYPSAPWLRYERNGKNYKKGDVTKDNEHLADATAVIEAGIATDEFKRLVSFLKAGAKVS